MELVPVCIIRPHPDARAGEIDDDVILAVAIEVTRHHATRVAGMEQTPGRVIDAYPDARGAEIEDDLVDAVVIEVTRHDTVRATGVKQRVAIHRIPVVESPRRMLEFGAGDPIVRRDGLVVCQAAARVAGAGCLFGA